MRNTTWKIKTSNQNKSIMLNNFPIDQDILKILHSRGIVSKKDIINFLDPSLDNIQSSNLLSDMKKSVDLIIECINNGKNIWIYGDYDVDGITSTSILYLALKDLGAEFLNYYIPIRDEGYGLNNTALKTIKNSGADLLITVDCGITSFKEIEFAKSIGLDVIITDHHDIQSDKIPNAYSIINPKRTDNAFTFNALAGVGVAFMLILNLYEKLKTKEEAYVYLDLVAIGTIADIVPLVKENRIFAKHGLEKLLYSENKGLRFLITKLFETAKLEFTTYDVGFVIAPVFNAAGRLKDAKMVVKLLTSDNDREIEVISKELINKNFERRELQTTLVELVEANIQKNNLNDNLVIVDASSEYHHGIIGIIASKVVDAHYKPAIIMEIKEDEGVAVASCRSIENFNIIKALQSMPELFKKCGGRAGAAGFTIPIKNIELFTKKINEFARHKMKSDDFVKTIHIDKHVAIHKISYEFCKSIELLKPFGFGNPNPTFQTKNVAIENVKFIGESKNHLMFDLKQNGFSSRNAVWFAAGEFFTDLTENIFYDIVYKLKVEPYQDKFYTKVYIDDVKKSELKNDTFFFLNSLYSTSFPMESVFYTNLDIDPNNKISTKFEFDQFSLFQGSKFIGKLDYNVSNLLFLINKYYGWNFHIVVKDIVPTGNTNIVKINIMRESEFESYDYTDKRLFINIKKFLIGTMEYDSYTKLLLSSFFKENHNLFIISKDYEKEFNLSFSYENFILTLGIYYYKSKCKKSQIVTKKKGFKSINNYFDINTEYQNDYDLTIFFGNVNDIKLGDIEVVDGQRFVFIQDFTSNENPKELIDKLGISDSLKEINYSFSIPENIIFLNSKNRNEIVDESRVFLKYLPLDDKIRIKALLDEKTDDPIFADSSIWQIL